MINRIQTLVVAIGCITLCLIAFSCSTLDPVTAAKMKKMESLLNGADPNFRSAVMKMIDKGVDSSYIYDILHHPNTKFIEKMVKINVTGFIKRADYSHNYNDASLIAARAFLQENTEKLHNVESLTGVSAEVITAILWVETKFGKITGTNNVISVYTSLAAADEQRYIDMNKQSFREYVFSADSIAMLDSVVEARARKKANWAVDQLIALQSMQPRMAIPINDLLGSWAGAFGWSQFIPSSYMSWAVDGDGDGKVDLYNKLDAMASVGNYLKVNGWGATRAEQEKAVFHYNNSKDYVDCVLTLADKIKPGN
ncbi:MAG: lytic murein transglycosylase [Candidatus Kapabacteria bacterium]|nr:lytic murein transglycosylase [Candidatus Kapabacteria bacterium]